MITLRNLFIMSALFLSACAAGPFNNIADTETLAAPADQITIIAKADIIPGQLEALKALVSELARHTEETEQGALAYRWFLNEDQTKVTVVETYANSEAVLFHASNYQPFAERLDSVRKATSITFYGELSNDLSAAIASMGFAAEAPISGFVR